MFRQRTTTAAVSSADITHGSVASTYSMLLSPWHRFLPQRMLISDARCRADQPKSSATNSPDSHKSSGLNCSVLPRIVNAPAAPSPTDRDAVGLLSRNQTGEVTHPHPTPSNTARVFAFTRPRAKWRSRHFAICVDRRCRAVPCPRKRETHGGFHIRLGCPLLSQPHLPPPGPRYRLYYCSSVP
jgi:hypothetical protein